MQTSSRGGWADKAPAKEHGGDFSVSTGQRRGGYMLLQCYSQSLTLEINITIATDMDAETFTTLVHGLQVTVVTSCIFIGGTQKLNSL